MEVIAKLRNAPLSAQKARLVADMIRGMNVSQAIGVLRFTSKKGAGLILKVLQSAAANAEHNESIDLDELTVCSIYVDEAPSLKRMSPRAKGRANRITKRTCHVTIKVSDGEK